MGLKRGNSQRRTTIRAISLFIIIGTIPFYLLGIGIWLVSPQNGGSDSGPTFTPLNAGDDDDSGGEDEFATFTPLGNDQSTQAAFPTFTPLGGGGAATYTYYTPDFSGLYSPTPLPTLYMSPTTPPTSAFTNTPPPSNTPAVAPTDVIIPTQPPLIPPTDTPSA